MIVICLHLFLKNYHKFHNHKRRLIRVAILVVHAAQTGVTISDVISPKGKQHLVKFQGKNIDSIYCVHIIQPIWTKRLLTRLDRTLVRLLLPSPPSPGAPGPWLALELKQTLDQGTAPPSRHLPRSIWPGEALPDPRFCPLPAHPASQAQLLLALSTAPRKRRARSCV